MKRKNLFISLLVKLFTVIFFTIIFCGYSGLRFCFGEAASRYKFLYDLSSNTSGIGSLNQPAGIAVDIAGNIYVADTVNSRVVVFDELGKIKLSFGKLGDKAGELNAPMALIVDSKGEKVYVADSSNNRVQVFKINGEFISTIDLSKALSDKDRLVRPIGIAISSQGNIYISDADNNYIRVYDSAGNFLFKFGGFGAEEGKLCLPVGLSIDKKDNVYVVDMNNARLQIFDKEGKFLSKIGSPGDTKGSFGKPKSVYVDNKGVIYVSDGANLVIQAFDKQGNFIDLIGAEKEKELQFASPFGLSGYNNRLYITDRWRNSVRVYEVKN
ncbi:MAG: NHL repeat-containing protein [Candidatus Omnitrophota bacterium]|nr:NHL repeat-containing protein [Candidatus Omnitrophota bacterium]